ncbi:3841_t:CDS:2 [Funneliformis geosporum]|uniref:3841_t:CDS:1 n=1 Tax=Funneliformis geosporum TaxID=1117311 RepID=A0A9W4WN58_9GLOM|nr:3841_t:CDS:2 [Funneliformis geosporum]
MTSEIITSDVTALIILLSLGFITSEKIINASQTISAEVLAFSQPNKMVIPYDAYTPYINVALKEYSYLFSYNNDRHNNGANPHFMNKKLR